MSYADTLVVGASVAGVRCARALRSASYEGTIVLADSEDTAPYDKPPLTKAFLDPGTPLPTLVEPDALAAAGIDFRPGLRATALDVAARTVHFGDEAIEFANLVIATGAAPRLLPVLDVPDLPVGVIRSADSALAIRRALRPGAVIVVVGGGFLGLEVSASAARLGASAHVIEFTDQVLGRGLAPEAAAVIENLHRERGTSVHLGCSVTGIRASERGAELNLSDGTTVDAEYVLVAIGASPAVGWLAGSSLTVSDGVVCDAGLEAAEGIFAVGDCAHWVNARYGRPMRLEHWTGAGEQATFVARRIASGQPGECAIVPYVWSDQFGCRIQIVGLRGDSTRVMRATSGERLFAECVGEDVVGVAAVDQPRAVLAARRILATSGRAPSDELFPPTGYDRIG